MSLKLTREQIPFRPIHITIDNQVDLFTFVALVRMAKDASRDSNAVIYNMCVDIGRLYEQASQ